MVMSTLALLITLVTESHDPLRKPYSNPKGPGQRALGNVIFPLIGLKRISFTNIFQKL